MAIIRLLRPTLAFLLLWTILLGGLYPLCTTFLAQAIFPYQAHGSLIANRQKEVLGSALIGQQFTKPEYFWGRLSATTPFAYNAASSSGSNFSIGNPDLMKAVQARIDALKAADPANDKPIPVDLVTASASGLDPHASLAAVEYQLPRVLRVRQQTDHHLTEIWVRGLITKYTEKRQLGMLGEPVVNILKLNLALDGKL